MEFRPILSAMRRNKVGAILIAVQMAITLAILCNALFIIEQRVALSKRPTGADEANVFVIDNQWVGNPSDLSARLQGDLEALRSIPGVQDAFASNSFPLSDGGSTTGLSLNPDQKTPTALTAIYFADEHALSGLGLKLIAGRNFNSGDVADKMGFTDLTKPTGIIITRVLAGQLFPTGSAVGRNIYDDAHRAYIPVIGVVDRLQVPWVSAGGWGSKFNDNSTLEPFHFVNSFCHYIVRAKPGQVTTVLQAAQKKLFEISRARVLQKTQTLTAARADIYRDDRGLIVLLGVVCA
jgi:putative ABC transport system permease protein